MLEEGNPAGRLVALETRLAHQDVVIEDLNATVTALWTEVERLTRVVSTLDHRLRETEAQASLDAPSKPPPHY